MHRLSETGEITMDQERKTGDGERVRSLFFFICSHTCGTSRAQDEDDTIAERILTGLRFPPIFLFSLSLFVSVSVF